MDAEGTTDLLRLPTDPTCGFVRCRARRLRRVGAPRVPARTPPRPIRLGARLRPSRPTASPPGVRHLVLQEPFGVDDGGRRGDDERVRLLTEVVLLRSFAPRCELATPGHAASPPNSGGDG